MKPNEILKLIELHLNKMSLTMNSKIDELLAHYQFIDLYKNELKKRLSNREDDISVLSLYINELQNFFRGKSIDLDADEINFRIQIQNKIDSGQYGLVKDSINDFFGHYLYDNTSKDKVQSQIPVIFNHLAELISRHSYIEQLGLLIKEVLKKNNNVKEKLDEHFGKTGNHHFKNEGAFKKIRWKAGPDQLAQLFIILAKKGWIDDFQEGRNGPNTAKAILCCFNAKARDNDNEIKISTFTQYLKTSIHNERDSKEFLKNFGGIKDYYTT